MPPKKRKPVKPGMTPMQRRQARLDHAAAQERVPKRRKSKPKWGGK